MQLIGGSERADILLSKMYQSGICNIVNCTLLTFNKSATSLLFIGCTSKNYSKTIKVKKIEKTCGTTYLEKLVK